MKQFARKQYMSPVQENEHTQESSCEALQWCKPKLTECCTEREPPSPPLVTPLKPRWHQGSGCHSDDGHRWSNPKAPIPITTETPTSLVLSSTPKAPSGAILHPQGPSGAILHPQGSLGAIFHPQRPLWCHPPPLSPLWYHLPPLRPLCCHPPHL